MNTTTLAKPTTQTTTMRCSALPLAWKCPESQFSPPDEVRLNISDEPAEVGQAFHRWMAARITGTDLDQDHLAAEHGVDADELKMLCAMGCKALVRLREYFSQADGPMQTEVALKTGPYCSLALTGTADVLARQGNVALVADWKTGRLDSDYHHQLMGYAYAATDHLVGLIEDRAKRIEEVVVITIWVRDGVWDVARFTAPQIAAWAGELVRRLQNGRGNFNPGGHCTYCQRAANCEGRRALVRSSIADMSVEGVKIMEWTPQTRAEMAPVIGKMFDRMRLVEGAATDFRATIKADVALHGPLLIGGGRQLAITTTKKRELNPAKARPVLLRHVDADDIEAATTISIGKIEDAAAAKAGKGGGAAAKRAIAADLEAAGAITLNPVHQLREGKAP